MSRRPDTLLGRTLRRFRRAWRTTSGRGDMVKHAVSADLLDNDVKWLREQFDLCLAGRGGEVSARALAAELGEIYLMLSETGRRRYLGILAKHYGAPEASVDEALEAVQAAEDIDQRRKAEARLREALVAPRVTLFKQFNALEQGVKFLVDLRQELIVFARDDPKLAPLESELRELLASWFDIGFLDLRRITWNTSAALLEKLIEYEAVHAIRSWDNLKHRLESGRRCYAFFHPSMPDEPLIFVQVALVTGMSRNIQTLLDEQAPPDDPDRADTAVFYSISNCQPGLAGVHLGNFLIKSVAADLSRDFPDLKNFATLSPIPGFRRWLEKELETRQAGVLDGLDTDELQALAGDEQPGAVLQRTLESDRWWLDDDTAQALKPVLISLAARYLATKTESGRAVDPVAHFHLSNGARIERLNWLADTSREAIRRSAGIMVNYRYNLAAVEKNHEAYTGAGRIATAAAVKKLM